MIKLLLFGGARLITGSADANLDPVLAQPRRLALLAYLACARPHGPVSRDTLQGIFWPEASQSRARRSLNQALYFLRKHLARELFTAPGRDSIGIDPRRLWCDVIEFGSRLDAGDEAGALSLYTGDLLKGVFVADGEEFERWLEEERVWLRRRAIRAAMSLANAYQARGELTETAHWLRQALDLEPHSESTFRRLFQLLVDAGDRAGARRELEAFERLLRNDFALPLPEDLRRILGPQPLRVADARPVPRHDVAPPMELPSAAESDAHVESERGATWSPGPARRHGLRRAAPLAAGLLATALIIATIIVARPRPSVTSQPLEPRRVLVAEFTDRTDAPELAAFGGIAADWIANALASSGIVDVLPWSLLAREASALRQQAGSLSPDGLARDLARTAGAGVVVTGSYFLRSDTIVFHARVTDVRTGTLLRVVESSSLPRDDWLGGMQAMGGRVAGALATVLDPRLSSWSHAASQPPSLDAYHAFAGGIEASLSNRPAEADSLFLAAGGRDASFAAPLIWAVRNAYEEISYDRARELLTLLDRGGVQLAPWDEAMLDYYRSRLAGEWEESYRHARRLAEIAPVSEWLLLWIHAAMATRRFAEALDVAERLDFGSGWLRDWPYARALPAQLHHLQGDFEAELRSASLMDGLQSVGAARARLRALAGLGRLDEHARLLELTIAGLPAGIAAGVLSDAAAELRTHGHENLARYFADSARSLREAGAVQGQSDPIDLARALRAADQLERSRLVLSGALQDTSIPRDVILKELALTAAAEGDSAEAFRLIGAVRKMTSSDGGWASLEAARVHALLGDHEAALRLIRESRQQGSGFYFWMHTVPEFHGLTEHPVFAALMGPRS